MPSTAAKLISEFVGMALLACVVVGSGIMGTNLSADPGVALLINTISTIFALAILILILGPISGAHFNPAVTLVSLANKTMQAKDALAYIVVQVAGAITGAIVANAMFDLAVIQISQNERVTTGKLIGEVIATAGLIIVIGVLIDRAQTSVIPVVVAGWIGSAYFFTSSTSFANPAITVGRVFSDTFAGIAPISVLPFIGAQLVGAVIGMFVVKSIAKTN
ncbi:MAG: aquaporin family protein [Candidatus Nanopelagicales bacterium]|nr:aquaporin family protein [Candidatus Nanopelagicales bacterium]